MKGTIDEALKLGVEHLERGEVRQADQIGQQIIGANGSGCAGAWELRAAVAGRLGKLDQTVRFLRQALAIDDRVARYHARLGAALTAQGELQLAETSLRRALELQPNDAEAHFYLGHVLRARGLLNPAVGAYRRAVEFQPHSAEAWFNLGVTLQTQGRVDETVACLQRAARLKPAHADTHFRLGHALRRKGLREQAADCYRRALQLQPDLTAAHLELANIFIEQNRLDEAIAYLQRVREQFPDSVAIHNNLGFALRHQGRVDEAIHSLRRALQLRPDASALNNLGNALRDKDLNDEAVDCFRRALDLQPDFAEAHNNLGNALKDQGLLGDAIACYHRALEIAPQMIGVHSILLCTTYLHSEYDSQQIYAEHHRWNEQHAAPLAKSIRPHDNDRTLDRRLRVGYVSPDFRCHPIGRFLLPVLESHDHTGHSIFCYSSVRSPDKTTERCRDHADVWRDVSRHTDARLAEQIREDRIDILVDLTMHMVGSRLLVFARKPAPVQVTYLAYCGTTGLETIDYRITDPYLDPPEEDTSYYSEKSIRLPESYWCYQPVDVTPDVQPPPSVESGVVTFGCLNNFGKVTTATLQTWGRLLHAVPRSQLLVHSRPGPHRDRVLREYADQGLAPERIRFVGDTPFAEYFKLYHEIDIALDPFPYGGGTTTCDALWMGAPVVSLAGQTAVGRGGRSILSNIGLSDLVAQDTAAYIQIAADLASQPDRLVELRTTLRERMRNSPLMEANRFTRHLEASFRQMWHNWCIR